MVITVSDSALGAGAAHRIVERGRPGRPHNHAANHLCSEEDAAPVGHNVLMGSGQDKDDAAPRGRGARADAARRRTPPRSTLAEIALRGQDRRAPDGRKLTRAERASILTIADINAPFLERARQVSRAARSPEVDWMVRQFLNPIPLSRRRGLIMPDRDLLDRALAFLRGATDVTEVAQSRLDAAVDDWTLAARERPDNPAWKRVEGTPVSLLQFRRWQDDVARAGEDLVVIPGLDVPAEFVRALRMVQQWDEILDQRGHVGERFSLREEVVRLHNWPGDQWDSGDDYASAQKRFHRRLRKARKLARDPVRDRIMMRALYLREGLLLNPVDDLEWFLAVLQFRHAFPEALEVRPELMSWRVLDWISRFARPGPAHHLEVGEADLHRLNALDALDPRDVDPDLLTGVGGPGVMIDLDEDVVTALPPGCRVRRMVVSARGPLGPDWMVYWVESEWGDSRPILDLVESEKLHPRVLFVSDGQPADLADLLRPFLAEAYEIPTNPLTAHSHLPGTATRIPDHPDAGLS